MDVIVVYENNITIIIKHIILSGINKMGYTNIKHKTVTYHLFKTNRD